MKLSNAIVTALVIAAGATLTMSAAQSLVLSDTLVVTDPLGTSTTFIAGEPAGGGGFEPGLVYAPIPGLDPLSMDIPFLLSMGAHFVMLTEPAGVLPDPGEPFRPVPCPPDDPGQQCFLSDIVVGLSDAVGIHVALYSDPHPALFDPALTSLFPSSFFLAETGAMQDLTGLLGFAGTGFKVEVMSDVEVVPVPAAVWLFGSALGLIGVMRRRATV